MKYLLIVLSLFSIAFLNAQEHKEVIKIKVDNECKSCINKRTYKDEIFTKQLKIASGFNITAQIGFAFQDNFMFENHCCPIKKNIKRSQRSRLLNKS